MARCCLAAKGVGGWVHGLLQEVTRERKIFHQELVSVTAVTASVNSLVLLINPSTLCPRLDIRLVRCFGLRA